MVTMPTRPTTTPPGPWSFPSSQRFTLDNGLRVIVHDLPGQYVVSAGLMLDVPLTSEPEDLEGVALLTASTLSEGTHDHPGTSFTEAVESSGEWISGLGMEPSDPQLAALWRREARTVAAYRDKYGIAVARGLGLVGDDASQRADAARARAATLRAQQLAARAAEPEPTTRSLRGAGPRL